MSALVDVGAKFKMVVPVPLEFELYEANEVLGVKFDE